MIKILNNQLYNEYSRRGYVLSKSVIDEDQCDKLRKYIKSLIRKNPKSEKNIILHSKCIKDKKIYEILFNKKINENLKKIFGKKYFINQFEIQYNSFPLKKNSGYHYDSQSERNNSYLKDKNYKFGKVGIYLQDNNIEFGGGINVVPYSHKIFPIKSLRLENYIKMVMSFFKKRISSSKGDAIIFDSRLLHTGTDPRNLLKNKNSISQNELEKNIKGNDKIAIYWNVCIKKYNNSYLRNSIERCIKHELNDSDHKYYSDHLRLHYPSNYSSNFRKQCQDKGISISSLSKELAKVMQHIYYLKQ
tara:strand:- start:3235 stop:4143 length:909 start_codon:yes stop_codon:yes gene_type:complete